MRTLLLGTKPAKQLLWASMALLLLGMSPSIARADVIIGNLGAGDGDSVAINSTSLFAGSFTLGSQAYALTDVQIRLTFSPPDSTRFRLQSDAAGQPSGAVLFTFDNPTFFSGNLTYRFNAGSAFTLAANTTYWLVGSTLTGFDANWVNSNPPTNPTGSGADFGNYASSTDSGGTWNRALVSDKPLFQLNGTPLSVSVPEPSSLVLVGTAASVAAVVGLRRRRTRRLK